MVEDLRSQLRMHDSIPTRENGEFVSEKQRNYLQITIDKLTRFVFNYIWLWLHVHMFLIINWLIYLKKNFLNRYTLNMYSSIYMKCTFNHFLITLFWLICYNNLITFNHAFEIIGIIFYKINTRLIFQNINEIKESMYYQPDLNIHLYWITVTLTAMSSLRGYDTN